MVHIVIGENFFYDSPNRQIKVLAKFSGYAVYLGMDNGAYGMHALSAVMDARTVCIAEGDTMVIVQMLAHGGEWLAWMNIHHHEPTSGGRVRFPDSISQSYAKTGCGIESGNWE